MNFRLQNYNDFSGGVCWHDYVSVILNEFPIILVRRYDWLDKDRYTLIVQIFGFTLHKSMGEM